MAFTLSIVPLMHCPLSMRQDGNGNGGIQALSITQPQRNESR